MLRLILASASPRRKELLAQAEIPYEVLPANCEETAPFGVTPAELVEELSLRKAEAVSLREKGDIVVLGADTLVAVSGHILGKPVDEEDAFRMLKLLQGNTHTVYTGVSLIRVWDGAEEERRREKRIFHEASDVRFYEMTDEEIREYIATGEPMDKAGSYGIQGMLARYIAEIRGSYTNIVGLPLGRTFKELKELCKEDLPELLGKTD